MMKILSTIKEVNEAILQRKSEGESIGFVPTMGFLHEGHLSLVRESIRKADSTVVSIFVNPTQFGPQEDFDEYPRDLRRDRGLLEKEGVDIVFVPGQKEMYPENFSTYVEVRGLQDKLCGRSRPGHFRGVCTVVLKLFQIVSPDIAFFGQKDAQQALIIQRMVRDLDMNVGIEILPIIREEDGLALSSRNSYLNSEGRKAAGCLFRSLEHADQMIKTGERDPRRVIQAMKQIVRSEPLAKIDYIEIVDLENLDPLDKIEGDALVALAVFIGKIRLIDNLIVSLKE
jgi:pantoate--beta-alanine ligase